VRRNVRGIYYGVPNPFIWIMDRLIRWGGIGLEKGYYQPTSYFVTDLMRMQSRGAVPGNDVLLDTVYWLVSGVSGLNGLRSPITRRRG